MYVLRNAVYVLTYVIFARSLTKGEKLSWNFVQKSFENLSSLAFSTKDQLILKANFQAVNSSIKRTNEFVFTTMRRIFVRFLE
jgi:hypothetical protein